MRKTLLIVSLVIMLLGASWASLSYYAPEGQKKAIRGIEWRNLNYEPDDNILFLSFYYQPPSQSIPRITVLAYFAPSHVLKMVDAADMGWTDVGTRRSEWGELVKIEFYGNDVRGGMQFLGLLSRADVRLMMNG